MKPNHKAGIELESVEEQQQALITLRLAQLGKAIDKVVPQPGPQEDLDQLTSIFDDSIREEKKRLQLDANQTELLKGAARLALDCTNYSFGAVDYLCFVDGLTREQAIDKLSAADSSTLQRTAVIARTGLIAAEVMAKLTLVA